MEKELVAIAHYLYIKVEKRSLPLEASKALVRSMKERSSKEIALSMVDRLKRHINFWIKDSSLAQIYKRYLNEISNSDRLSFGEAISPFVLISGEEIFESEFERIGREERIEFLRNIFRAVPQKFEFLDKASLIRSLALKDLLPENRIPFASHVAFNVNPHIFVPLTPSTMKALNVEDVEDYLYLCDSLRTAGIKPIEALALFHLMWVRSSSKISIFDRLVNIDRRRLLLEKAKRLWEEGEFYKAHEVLEDMWDIVDKEEKDPLRGVIQLAIALHWIEKGDYKKAQRVLKRALDYMREGTFLKGVDLKTLRKEAQVLLKELNDPSHSHKLPELRVV